MATMYVPTSDSHSLLPGMPNKFYEPRRTSQGTYHQQKQSIQVEFML
jgi:hypothetical protein